MPGPEDHQEAPTRRFAWWSRLLRRTAVAGLGVLGLSASVSALERHTPTAEPTLESRSKRGKLGKLVLRLGGAGLKRSPGHGSHRSHSSHSSHSSHASHYSGSGGSPTPAPPRQPAPRSDPAPFYTPRPAPEPKPPAPPITVRPPGGDHVGIDTPVTIVAVDPKARKVSAKLGSGLVEDFFYAPTVEILVYASEALIIQLDQLLAIAPEASPLRAGRKVVINWTYQNHKRVALRFSIDPAQGAK